MTGRLGGRCEDAGFGSIAQAFVAARRAARALPNYPGLVPETLREGYRIQDEAIALWGERPAGWKVGRIPDPLVDRYGANRLIGPIFPEQIFEAGAEPTPMPVFAGGFGAVEAEFLFVLGAVPAGQSRFTLDGAAALVERVHIGIEIASSPFPGINELGPAVTVSDFGNNAGLLIGAEVPDWRGSGLGGWPVTVDIDGERIGEGRAETMPDGAVGAVRFLLELAAERGLAMPAGTIISTGAVSGVHPIAIGQHAIATFGSHGAVECRIVDAAGVQSPA